SPHILHLTMLAGLILFSACEPDDSVSPTPDPTQSTLVVLKSNQWKVIAKENILKLEGALGGGRGTIAFTTQKPDELRWYTKHFTMANFSDHHEMIINRQDQVTINKDFKAPSYGGDIKGFVGTDVWKVNMAEVANWVYVFKNDQMVDLSENPEGQTNIVRIQASEDGMLNSSETLTLN